VNAGTLRYPQRLPGARNILTASPRQPRYDRTSNDFRDSLYRLEVPFRGDWEPRFDHVHAQPIKLMRQPQLFLLIHAASRRLLAIAESGIEDSDPGSLATH
jgi:hypothetical protein